MATLDALRARQTEIRSRLAEIDADAAGERFTETQTQEWNDLNEELEQNRAHIAELEARQDRLNDLVERSSVESEQPTRHKRGVRKLVPDNPSDIASYRSMANDIDELHEGYKQGALRVSERMTAAPYANREKSQERIEHLIRYVDSPDNPELSQRVIATSGETYQRAWGKYVMNKPRTREEETALERAMSLTVGSGGYAVPYTLDPTVIIVSGGATNPVRDLARIETITGNNWLGISSTGVTAAYAAEATETSDNAPAFVQPSLTVDRAQAFVPMSIEISQDWGAVMSELGRLFSDAKNRLESTQFLTGLGHASSAPQGLLVGATAVNSTATTAVLAAGDLYTLRNALGEQWQDNATIVGHRATFDKIRQFDTGGGANLWVQLAFDQPATLLGYPARQWSAYSSATTTSGSTVLTIGDFSNFLIVDRVGMDVELIPHLFATANNRPSGQRGLFCYWRNTSGVLTPGLSANSAFQSLKIL